MERNEMNFVYGNFSELILLCLYRCLLALFHLKISSLKCSITTAIRTKVQATDHVSFA